MADAPYSTDNLILALRKLAETANHGNACDLNEAANRLQDHNEAFLRLAQALPGAHKAEDYHEVTKSSLALITTKSDFSIGTLFTMLGNQLLGIKSRREFSLMYTRFQEVEMWYRQALREIELDQEEEPSIFDALVSLVQPVESCYIEECEASEDPE